MSRLFLILFAVVAAAVVVVGSGTACSPEIDHCDGVSCDPGRICIDLSTGPRCVCNAGSAPDDAGVCIEEPGGDGDGDGEGEGEGEGE